MNKNVVVTTVNSESNDVLRQTSNPDKVSVRLSQEKMIVTGGLFLNKSTLTTFVTMDKEIAESLNLEAGMNWKDVIGQDCKIMIKEQTTPFYDGQEPKINPQTKAELSTADGEKIYRQTCLTVDLEEKDQLVQHQRVEVGQNEHSVQGDRSGEQFN